MSGNIHIIIFCKLLILGRINCLPPLAPLTVFNANVSDSASEFSNSRNCPVLGTIRNGNLELKENMGRTAFLVNCDEGFTLIGKNYILSECLDGQWKFDIDEMLPKCEKRCSPPPYLENGKLDLKKKLEDIYTPMGTFSEGTLVTYACNEGYTLEPLSSAVRFCRKGIWSGTDVFCKAILQDGNCPNPPSIENGFMQPNFPIEYSPISEGQEVSYQCMHGYNLIGLDKIKCSNNGLWLPEPPTCHKESGNPFADFAAPTSNVSNGMPMDFFAQPPTANQTWGGQGANAFPAQIPQAAPFGDLTGVFNSTGVTSSVFDPLGSAPDPKLVPAAPAPQNAPPQRPAQPSKILTGDLESSLNSLVENLTMDSGGGGKWNSPKNQPKTSTAIGWQPQLMVSTNAASYRPMMGGQGGQQQQQQPFGGGGQFMGGYQQPQVASGSPKVANAQRPQHEQNFDPFGDL